MTASFSAPWAAEGRRSAEETRAVSLALIGQAEACAATAASLCREAAGLRGRARVIRRETGRPAMRPQPVVSFSLEGVVEHRDVHAEWHDGRLVADPLLLERAHLVVGLEEQFQSPNAGSLTASLTGRPIVALLTLMRACDQVRRIDVVGPGGRPGRTLAQP